jgi:hypothetical protein
MADNIGGKPANDKPASEEKKADAESDIASPAPNVTDDNSACSNKRSENPKRDGFDIFNAFVLVLAFLAAAVAACEATRLANSTDIAIRNASDDAKNQRRIAVDTEQRQLRAYVGQAPSGGALSYWPPTGQFTAHIRLLNTGLTPAFKVRTTMAVHVLPYPRSDKSIFVEYPIGPAPSTDETLFPQDYFDANKTSDETLSWNDYLKALAPKSSRRIYAYGAVSYIDSFGQWHTTHFCVSFVLLRDVPNPRDLKSTGFINGERCVLDNNAD